jgi:hypothetical protein
LEIKLTRISRDFLKKKTKQIKNFINCFLFKRDNEFMEERREMVIHSLLCIALNEILKQLSFHPGNDELLSYIIDLSFKRFLAKDIVAPPSNNNATPHAQHQAQLLYQDNQYVTDLYAEVVGCIAQSRFALVKRRFTNEFQRLRLNISPLSNNTGSGSTVTSVTAVGSGTITVPQQASGQAVSTMSLNSATSAVNNGNSATLATTASADSDSATGAVTLGVQSNSLTTNAGFISPTSANIIKLFMGMKHFRIKMVPIEDFEVIFFI